MHRFLAAVALALVVSACMAPSTKPDSSSAPFSTPGPGPSGSTGMSTPCAHLRGAGYDLLAEFQPEAHEGREPSNVTANLYNHTSGSIRWLESKAADAHRCVGFNLTAPGNYEVRGWAQRPTCDEWLGTNNVAAGPGPQPVGISVVLAWRNPCTPTPSASSSP